jgi:hypothetical protein
MIDDHCIIGSDELRVSSFQFPVLRKGVDTWSRKGPGTSLGGKKETWFPVSREDGDRKDGSTGDKA